MNQIHKSSNRRRNNAPVNIDPVEESLIRIVYQRVGGPSKLSTFEDPDDVRDVVVRALADEQPTAADSDRINRGNFTPLERRVVRTVTNRGAAVRSRMRLQRELQQLRDEVARKDAELRQIKGIVAECAKHSNMARKAAIDPSFQDCGDTLSGTTTVTHDGYATSGTATSDMDDTPYSSVHFGSQCGFATSNSCASVSMDSLSGLCSGSGFMRGLNTSLDFQNFPNIIDPLS